MRRVGAGLCCVGLAMAAGCGFFQGEAAPPPSAQIAREVPSGSSDRTSATAPGGASADSIPVAPEGSASVAVPGPPRGKVKGRGSESPAEGEASTGPPGESTGARPAGRRGGSAESSGAAASPEPSAEPRRRPSGRPAASSRTPVPVLPGAILPRERIVAFYGHANSPNMGILGELPPDEMLARLDREVQRWREADPSTPVRPALHLITTMATGDPGPDGSYRLRMPASLIDRVLGWAERRDALLFLDIQPGRSDVADELPRLERWLSRPDVHLALDPEWRMPEDGVPGKVIGSMTASEVNQAIEFLAALVDEHDLPPKILVVHRFTENMLPDPERIETDPRVQVVVNMDGWGPPAQKLNTYRAIVAPEVYQWAGFKLFFKNDRWGGSRLLTPEELLALSPVPLYIQYQ